MLADFAGKRVLLLQGPNGPFFRRLGEALRSAGAIVTKINLNAADQLFYPGPDALAYRGTLEDWPDFLDGVLRERSIDCAFLFGDCRPYHVGARPMLDRNGVEPFVVEEGYLRPDHLTIEPGGVNVNSRMSRDPDSYTRPAGAPPAIQPVRSAFGWSVFYTILNSLCITLFGFLYPHYRHHRDVNTWRQALRWGWGFVRRFRHLGPERRVLEKLSGPLSKRYFLAALQVHNDYQVKNSRFGDVRTFLLEVVDSFARHANPSDYLVVKHHPADRAYRDYGKLLRQLAVDTGLGERLIYVHDPHLPTLLKHAKGTVVINSTIAFSSFHHKTPVKALGVAVYDWMGLSAPGELEDFWNDPPAVDIARYQLIRHWLLHHNQVNGSVWVPIAACSPHGFAWPPGLAPRRRASNPAPLPDQLPHHAVREELAGLRPRLASSPGSE
ncbi:MAG TPA: capsular biosynthesis protein [Polyangiaceae bacterium]|nr:capsular biosynthesis protein [Polyangiaceae bacterium]